MIVLAKLECGILRFGFSEGFILSRMKGASTIHVDHKLSWALWCESWKGT